MRNYDASAESTHTHPLVDTSIGEIAANQMHINPFMATYKVIISPVIIISKYAIGNVKWKICARTTTAVTANATRSQQNVEMCAQTVCGRAYAQTTNDISARTR